MPFQDGFHFVCVKLVEGATEKRHVEGNFVKLETIAEKRLDNINSLPLPLCSIKLNLVP
jgi:hypothetical protein